MDSVLFIIGSPFQCLCMLEAIRHFDISDYSVMVAYCDKLSLDKIRTLLNEKGIAFEEKKIAHIVKDFIPMVFSKHKRYKNIFIGNYYRVIDEIVGILYAKRRYTLYYLDDGTQALSLFSDNPRKRYPSFKIGIVLQFYFLCLSWKKRISTNFFTIYDVKSSRMNIIHNSLSYLRPQNSISQQSVVIVGSNSSFLRFKDYSYFDYLNGLMDFIKRRWPDEIVYYCPHRRDRNNSLNQEWCYRNNVDYFEPEVSVEYDFVIKGINPFAIIGFTSNALYTLKSLYPSSEVHTVYYHVCDESADRETETIRQQMMKSGILSLNLTDE